MSRDVFETEFFLNKKEVYLVVEYEFNGFNYLPNILKVSCYDENNNKIQFPENELDDLAEFILYKLENIDHY